MRSIRCIYLNNDLQMKIIYLNLNICSAVFWWFEFNIAVNSARESVLKFVNNKLEWKIDCL